MLPLSTLFEEGLVWSAESIGEEHRADSASFSFEALAAMARPKEDVIDGNTLVVPFGISDIDAELPGSGLVSGALHEFLFDEMPPLSLLGYISGQVFRRITLQKLRFQGGRAAPKVVLWVGQEMWPGAHFLERIVRFETAEGCISFLPYCLFAAPRDAKQKLLIIETALRSQAVAAVFACCPKLSFQLSRRFTLAARAGNVLGVIARPSAARRIPTSARTRWGVKVVPTETKTPHWMLTLQKIKGRQPLAKEWIITLNDSGHEDAFENLSLALSSESFASASAVEEKPTLFLDRRARAS